MSPGIMEPPGVTPLRGLEKPLARRNCPAMANELIETRILGKPLFHPFKLLSVVDYPPGCGVGVPHKHDFFHVLSVVSGEFKLWDRRGQGVVIRPGGFLIVPPEWEHSWRIDERCLALQICFSPFLAEEYGELFQLFGDIQAEWRLISLGRELFEVFFKKIEAEFDSSQPGSSVLMHSFLMELFAVALRTHCGGEEDINGVKGNDWAVMRRALDYIQRRYRGRISVKDLAANSYLGESRFFQVFKKYAGVSPLNYVAKFRMEKAKALLTCSHMSVSQVADFLGYESIHYFSRAYKRHYGVPPSKDQPK